MTIVELLLALALLSALAVACLGWTAATGRSLAQVAGPVSWRLGAGRSLDLIGDSLLAGDLALGGERREQWRVEVLHDSITLRTRAIVEAPGGAPTVCTELRIHLKAGSLVAEFRDQHGSPVVVRPLIDRVSTFSASAAVMEDRWCDVTVRIGGAGGEFESRSWRFSESEVQR